MSFWRSFEPAPGVQLNLGRKFLLYTDGASPGNNVKGGGHGGAGAALYLNGQEVWTLSRYLGHPVTNIMAEYSALILSLQYLHTILQAQDELLIRLDLKLIDEQLTGVKQAREPHVQQLLYNTRQLLTGINYKMEWIPREQNSRADGLAKSGAQQR